MSIDNVRAGEIMPEDDIETQSRTTVSETDSAGLIDRLCELPEPQALEFYSQLSPRLQWLARQGTTGQRRAALIARHLMTAGRCR
jgi:hypothetical protein